MPQEPLEHEAIRQEMDETRSSLTDKISMLEQQVVDTVHEASTGVKETVEAVKEAVQDTVQSVKTSMGETVDSVKDTFSVSRQVDKNPWMMMAGSVGAGFLAGYVLNAPSATAVHKAAAPLASTPRTGNGSGHESIVDAPTFSADRQATPSGLASGVAQLSQIFESEIKQLKGLAIGTLAGILRDMVVDTVPEMMRNPLQEVFNDVTVKCGGHTIPGRIFAKKENGCEDDARERTVASSSYVHPRQSMPFPK